MFIVQLILDCFFAPEERNVYSTELLMKSSSLRRSEMFIVPSSLRDLPRSGGATVFMVVAVL